MLACSGTANPPRGLGPSPKSECSKYSPRAHTAIVSRMRSVQLPGSGAHIVPGGLKPFMWNSSPKALRRGTAMWQAPHARLKRRAKAGRACAAGTIASETSAATTTGPDHRMRRALIPPTRASHVRPRIAASRPIAIRTWRLSRHRRPDRRFAIVVGWSLRNVVLPRHRRRIPMRRPMPPRAFALVVAVAVAAAVAPAHAKKTKHTPCAGHFLLDSGESLVTNASSTAADALEVAGKQVTIGGTCVKRASLHTTRTGWRLQARGSSCGDPSRIRITATIGFDCQKLTRTPRATHTTRRRFTAHLSGCDTGSVSYASTWDAIQKTIFVRHDCANDLCHGSAKQGGLDLRPDAAYRSLAQGPSTEVPSFYRVTPGDERRSYLWLKLLAKTDPTKLPNELPPGVQLAGSPMPNNTTTLSKGELEVLRRWIYTAGPVTVNVSGTQTALNACLPPAAPITAIPLDPPPPDTGHQFTMPPWKLEAHSQHEYCFATYFDFTDKVPAEFKIPAGLLANGCFDPNGCFTWDAQTLRQDPQSHHLIPDLFIGSLDQIHHPALGTW